MNAYGYSLDELLTHLAQTPGASDLILTVNRPPMMKTYGEVRSLPEYPDLTRDNLEALTFSVLGAEQAQRFIREKEMDLSYEVKEVGRFRVNLFRQRCAVGLVARIVMERVPGFRDLGLPEVILDLAKLRKGLVLFTGPTGQGKSTSVAAMVDHLCKSRHCHIITIEDPIEYLHHHDKATIEQREVGIDTESFHAALRRVLRQAPDVVVIGEIRDRESAQVAMTLAETGHLILATLHTSGAIASVNRLIDMFPPEQERQIRTQIAAALAAVIWQQLIPAKGGNKLVLACEVLIGIPSIRSLIRQGRIHEAGSIIQTGRKHGMFTMDQSIEDLRKAGQLDEDWFHNNLFDVGKKAGH